MLDLVFSTCFYDAVSMIEFVLRLKISLRDTIKTRRIKENHVSHYVFFSFNDLMEKNAHVRRDGG